MLRRSVRAYYVRAPSQSVRADGIPPALCVAAPAVTPAGGAVAVAASGILPGVVSDPAAAVVSIGPGLSDPAGDYLPPGFCLCQCGKIPPGCVDRSGGGVLSPGALDPAGAARLRGCLDPAAGCPGFRRPAGVRRPMFDQTNSHPAGAHST